MKQFFLKLFTWWNGQTFGTQLWTWRFGELVGTDEQGNRYYRTAGRKIDPTLGFERRWVIYNGLAEAIAHSAGLAWLDAPHRRRRADRRELHAARMAKAACPEHDGDARGLPSVRLDPGERPPPEGHRRLPALDAGKLKLLACHSGARVSANPESRTINFWIPGSHFVRPGMTE